MNTLSSTGEDLIKSFEELRLEAYQDQRGVWTIAWGHTRGVKEGDTCTAQMAEAWFISDTQFAVNGVDASITTNLTQSQFDALVSFTFNVGVGAEAHSTMAKLINIRDFAGASEQFPAWDHIDGVPNAGLLRRRLAEQALFNA